MNYNGYHTVEKYGCDGCAFFGIGCSRPVDFPEECDGEESFIWVKDTTGSLTVTLNIDTEALEKDLAEFFSTRNLSKYVKISNQGS